LYLKKYAARPFVTAAELSASAVVQLKPAAAPKPSGGAPWDHAESSKVPWFHGPLGLALPPPKYFQVGLLARVAKGAAASRCENRENVLHPCGDAGR
jgi:hypothetical protein